MIGNIIGRDACGLFLESERTLEQRSRLARLPEVVEHHPQVREQATETRMHGAAGVLIDRERASEETRGLVRLKQRLHHREIGERPYELRGIRRVRPFMERERASEDALCLRHI